MCFGKVWDNKRKLVERKSLNTNTDIGKSSLHALKEARATIKEAGGRKKYVYFVWYHLNVKLEEFYRLSELLLSIWIGFSRSWRKQKTPIGELPKRALYNTDLEKYTKRFNICNFRGVLSAIYYLKKQMKRSLKFVTLI